MENLQSLKKAELVELCEQNGIEHEGLKNDDLRALLAAHYESKKSACESCVYFRPDARLGDYNISGIPTDVFDICKYYRSILLVRPKVCEAHTAPGIGMTTDARINKKKRRSIFDEDEN